MTAVYSMTSEQLTEQMNMAIDAHIDIACKKGIIDDLQKEKLTRLRVVCSDRKHLFSKFYSWMFGSEEGHVMVHVVTKEN